MDHLHERLERLEQRTHTVERQLRWWRSLACGLAVVGLLGWGLPLGLAREEDHEHDKNRKGLAHRIAALEKLLKHFSREGMEIFITGANLHIVNGLGSTDCGELAGQPIPDCPNGLGNLIVGYNELRPEGEGGNVRTGSHNVVVGPEHNFSRFGGIVVGNQNEIIGDFASVSGGVFNTASGPNSSVSGGANNTASGFNAVVSGGAQNTADNFGASVSGGSDNTASGVRAAVSGGLGNTASGFGSSVSGGGGNTASNDASSVSGGRNITQETEFGWAAGSEGDEVVVGNFRSP